MKRTGLRGNIGLLVLGTALLVLAQVRFGVGILAWWVPVPFLVYLQRTEGGKARLLLFGVFVAAWSLATAKYITDPFPKVLILVNGVSFAVVSFAGYMAWDFLRRHVSTPLGNLGFAAILVSIDWAQYMFTPLATNGSAAYTQLENLPFLQWASLFGVTGISFLMYWFGAVVASAIAQKQLPLKELTIVVSVIVVAHVYGALRIGKPSPQKTVRVATVGTDFDWFGGDVPAVSERQGTTETLFKNTRTAAEAGARLIVWNEVSMIVLEKEEEPFLQRVRQLAKEVGSHVVVSYLRPVKLEPLLVENKYVWVGPDGAVRDTYLKYKPLPGEPSIPGDGKAKTLETGFGLASGAICYEMDFPQVGLQRARDGAALVFVPSSDNLGVDPFHTQVAGLRAIEGGYSVLRSTRMGLSAGIDAHGRIRGWLSDNETDARILFVELPVERTWTLYSLWGDVAAYLSILFVLALIGVAIRNRKN